MRFLIALVVIVAGAGFGLVKVFSDRAELNDRAAELVEEAEALVAEGDRIQADLAELGDQMDEVIGENGEILTDETDMASEDDPYLWLEDVDGEDALAWVREQNAATFETLKSNPLYDELFPRALEVYTSSERLAFGAPRDGFIYNFWQDAEHVQGIWRRATLDSYLAGTPDWDVILDLDALNEAEMGPDSEINFVWHGVDCLEGSSRCLVSLSPGGLDADIVREFDMETREFVEGGFTLEQSKQTAVWVDENTLMVATDRGEGTMTESGYPNSVVLWERGTALEDAPVVFEGELTDVGTFPGTYTTPDGNVSVIVRAETFFEFHHFLVEDGGALTPLPAPLRADMQSVHAGQVVFGLNEDWTVEVAGEEQTFPAGSVISYALDDVTEDRALDAVHVVYQPDARGAFQGAKASGGALYVAVSENVVGKVYRGTFVNGGWTLAPVALPDNGTVSIASTDDMEDIVFYNYENFLIPDSMYVTRDGGTPEQVASLPSWFDAAGLVITQEEAVSADGTRVPYFLVRSEDAPMDGTTPTLLYGYGGFQISQQPFYSGGFGRMWMERGGALALANIRGGGEFGPAWHQAALQENRQRSFDDFIAIAEDMIADGVTSPEHLGIMGGSNGGLLVGAVLVQRPDLFGAVVCQVPLLDMLRYHMLLAGASWVGEYGDPDDPEQRAFIEAYSPYQNLDPDADYPRVFMYTSTRDDRVHPGHARKFTARMIEQGHDILYFERIEGGHAGGANLEQSAERVALEFTYLWEQLGAE